MHAKLKWFNNTLLSAILIFCVVYGFVALALLHHATIALRYLLGHPSRYVFGCGIEGQYLVEIGMVKTFLHKLLDVGEVTTIPSLLSSRDLQ